jgi:outer membrane receptor protein involved in Fe transport
MENIKVRNFLIAAIALLLISAFGFGQERNFPEGKGKISGTVLDKTDSSPIQYASVTVHKDKDSSIVAGTQTSEDGSFTLEVPYGRYVVEVNIVGYSIAQVTGVMVTPKNSDVQLKTIMLKQGNTTTQEIEVTGERSYMQLEPDKKVFNVGQDLTTLGGSATDVLKNVPSVQVDQDGNVSLRGSSNVKVYIDGKPSGINADNMADMLEQIPASSIQSVELITNPNAKYEAEGSAGIINIVLKKNLETGYNGNLSMNVGTKDKYNGSFNLNLKNKKFNITTNYSYRLFNMNAFGTTLRQNETNNTSSLLNQTNDMGFRMNGHFGKAQVDYLLDDKNVLSLSANFRDATRTRGESSISKNFDNTNTLSSIFNSKSDEKHSGYNFDLSLNYSAKFKDPKNTLNTEASFSRHKDDEADNIVQQSFDPNYIPAGNQLLRNTDQNSLNDIYNFQSDYVQPLGKESKLETGIKAQYTKNTSDFTSEIFDHNLNTWIPESNMDNNFTYKEQIYAAYGVYTSKIKNFGYQLGARLEQTITKGELLSEMNDVFDRHYLDIFPNVNLSQKFGESTELQLSYSRRINRPRNWFLNPFREYEDPYNIHSGNPDLKPEYVDSYELSFAQYLPGTVITPSVFYKKTHDMITRTISLIDSNTTLSTFSNDASAKAYGVELVVTTSPFQWLNFNGNVSYFRNEVTGAGSLIDYTNSNSTWTSRLMANVNLPLGFAVQGAFNYQGAMVMPQGTLDPIYSFDGAVKKDLFNRKLTINFRVSDIFNTQKFNANLIGSGFTQSFTRQRDSRNAFLTLTYNFGTPEKNKMRDKKKEQNDNNNDDSSPGFDF